MKTKTPLFFTAGSLLLVLASFDVGTALIYLLLAGEIPGTHIIIPATTMLTIYGIVALVVTTLVVASVVHTLQVSRQQQRIQQLPRRRFSQAI